MTDTEGPLRLVKPWEGHGPTAVWQAVRLGARDDDSLPKRLYLVIDAEQKTADIRLQTEKPRDLRSQGVLADRLRKHLKTAVIHRILQNPETGDLWIPFAPKPDVDPTWYVQLARTKPPEIRIIQASEGAAVARKTSKGSYTKKASVESQLPRPPWSGWDDILPQRLAAVKAAPQQETPAEDKEKADSVLPDYQRSARDRVKRRVKTVRKFLNKLEAETPSEDDLNALSEKSGWLQTYLYKVAPGERELTVDPEETGLNEPLSIELDEDKSPGDNLEAYFHKLKKAKRAASMGRRKLEQTRNSLTSLEEDLKQLREAEMPQDQVESILRRHGIPVEKPKAPQAPGEKTALPYRVLTLSGGVRALVGKGSKENDELTKGAKSNDFWIHAVGVTGSHVILPAREVGQNPSSSLLREAAILALYNSKLRGSGAGEVYVARKKDIKKKKGMPPGLWSIEKADTLFVRYSDEELNQVLGQTSSPS